MTRQGSAATPRGAADEGEQPWWTPGIRPVAPGVHRIPLPMPHDGLRAINVYAIQTDDGIDLIDSGCAIPQSRPALDSALRTLGASLPDIRRILVTHIHHDHFTHAVHIRRDFRATIYLSEGERASLEEIISPSAVWRERIRTLVRLFGVAQGDGFGPDGSIDNLDWELPDGWLSDDQRIELPGRDLTVIATPGHTQGHVVFHDTRHRLLFTGDHILPTITPSIGLEPVHGANPLGDFLNSLARVRARPDAMLLPAHGDVTSSVHRRVDELVAHHATRLDGTATAVRRGAATAMEVAHQLTWTRRNRPFSTLDKRNQWLAVSETAAHLGLLVAQGRLAASMRDGTRYYRTAAAT